MKECKFSFDKFVIMFFAIVMGFSGLSLSYAKINSIFNIGEIPYLALKFLTTGIFFIILFCYIIKIIKYPQAVKEELFNPVKVNFFAAASISMMLVSSLHKEIPILNLTLFYTGLALQTFLTFFAISLWINKEVDISLLTPAWFIPIVGNLIVITTSNEIEFYLWYYFCIGMFFYVILLALIFYRLFFKEKIAPQFAPTLFILIAPPAVGFIDYTKLTLNFDIFAIFLINLAIFFLFLMPFLGKIFYKIKFCLSWWAFTFPLAAASMAFLQAYKLSNQNLFLYLGVMCFIFLSICVLITSTLTIKNIINGNLWSK